MESREIEGVDPVPALRRFAVWGSDPTQRFVGRDEAWLAFRLPSGPVTVRYAKRDGVVTVRAWGPGAREAIERAPEQLGVDDDSWRFESDHPLVGKWLRAVRNLRFGKTRRVVERLVPVVIGQKVTSADASRTFREMVHRWGERAPEPEGVEVPAAARDLWLPPSPARLAELAYFDLHEVNLERKRAEVILGIARRATRLETFADLPASEVRSRLLAMPGIGPWSAALVVSAVHGDTDQVPLGDYHIANHVVHALTGRARGTDDEMLELLEPFRPHRGRALAAILREGPSAPRFGPRMPDRDIRKL